MSAGARCDLAAGRRSLCGDVEVRFTGRSEGDMASDADGRRAVVSALPWTCLRQVHGADVVTVPEPGARNGALADGAVSGCRGAALAVLTADCAPVALASPEGIFAVAHAGWRGLLAGIIAATVARMRELGAGPVEALLGPCIHPECYPFGPADLAEMTARFGTHVAGVDRSGAPALDLPAAVGVSLAQAGVRLVGGVDACTACHPRYWSWRHGGDRARQATVAWRP
ncbi:MAG: polyphenol oxidase family protein [Acidimicrobiales bacterium]